VRHSEPMAYRRLTTEERYQIAVLYLGIDSDLSPMFWRHYRMNPKRNLARPQELLRDLA
jgi:hypothetical protein